MGELPGIFYFHTLKLVGQSSHSMFYFSHRSCHLASGADSSALVDVDSGALVEVDSSALVGVDGSPLVERESDADSAPEILEKIFVEDLPLPNPTKKKVK
jgi:hypothetical protein